MNAFAVSAVAVPEVIDCVEVAGVPDPSLALKVTVFELAVHCAYKTTAASGIVKVIEPVPAYEVPRPLAKVFQPLNVKPVLVKVFAATVTVLP